MIVFTIYFLLFIFVTANLVASAIVQNSLNDLSERSDFQLPQEDLTIPLQGSSEDFLALDGSSDGTNLLVNGGNDNIFADSSGVTNSFSSVGGWDADYFDLAEASPPCQSEADGGQSLSKLRARNGICTTDGQSSSDISDFINNAVGIFGNPFDKKEDETQGALSTTNEPDTFCERRFPNRLCCEVEGELGTTNPAIYPPGLSSPTVFKTFDICQVRKWCYLKPSLFCLKLPLIKCFSPWSFVCFPGKSRCVLSTSDSTSVQIDSKMADRCQLLLYQSDPDVMRSRVTRSRGGEVDKLKYFIIEGSKQIIRRLPLTCVITLFICVEILLV